MDIATIAGVFGGLGLVLFGTFYAGLGLGDIFDIPSLFITFGGGTASAIAQAPLSRLMMIPTYTKFAFTPRNTDVPNLILTLVNFSERARREGLLSLEDDLANLDEPFLRKGIQLVVDGTDPELVRNILETDIENLKSRHSEGIKFWNDTGFYFPAFGMLGTLVGLVQMLKNLGAGDPAAIGAGMAAALITTLYGSMGANILALPLSKKLALRSDEEVTVKTIMIEGILSIQSGDNPRIVKDKLASFLAPSERGALEEGGQ
jgi:chemotaxis protein MotA